MRNDPNRSKNDPKRSENDPKTTRNDPNTIQNDPTTIRERRKVLEDAVTGTIIYRGTFGTSKSPKITRISSNFHDFRTKIAAAQPIFRKEQTFFPF